MSCALEPMRDVEGFYSFDVLQACLQTHGHAVVPINPQLVIGCAEMDFLSNVCLTSTDTIMRVIVAYVNATMHAGLNSRYPI